jgi:hypothetical protein
MKLTINYDGHDLKMEEELSEVLEKHGFECIGSGFGFGNRDMEFENKEDIGLY